MLSQQTAAAFFVSSRFGSSIRQTVRTQLASEGIIRWIPEADNGLAAPTFGSLRYLEQPHWL